MRRHGFICRLVMALAARRVCTCGAVLVAIRSGKLVRQPCERCGAEPAHAHVRFAVDILYGRYTFLSMKRSPNAAYGNHQMLASVLRRAARPMTLAELRAVIGGDPADILATVQECVDQGLIRASAHRDGARTWATA